MIRYHPLKLYIICIRENSMQEDFVRSFFRFSLRLWYACNWIRPNEPIAQYFNVHLSMWIKWEMHATQNALTDFHLVFFFDAVVSNIEFFSFFFYRWLNFDRVVCEFNQWFLLKWTSIGGQFERTEYEKRCRVANSHCTKFQNQTQTHRTQVAIFVLFLVLLILLENNNKIVRLLIRITHIVN